MFVHLQTHRTSCPTGLSSAKKRISPVGRPKQCPACTKQETQRLTAMGHAERAVRCTLHVAPMQGAGAALCPLLLPWCVASLLLPSLHLHAARLPEQVARSGRVRHRAPHLYPRSGRRGPKPPAFIRRCGGRAPRAEEPGCPASGVTETARARPVLARWRPPTHLLRFVERRRGHSARGQA